MDRPPKVIGVIVLTDGSTEKACEVLGVTSRTSAPSLDVRWSLAGVYVLRLQTMVLLAIPVDRVRGRDPTPWRCTNPAHAWRLWWGASLLSRKEKKRRCPWFFWDFPESRSGTCLPLAPEYQPKPDDVCPAKLTGPCRFLFADRGCVNCGGVRPRDRHP